MALGRACVLLLLLLAAGTPRPVVAELSHTVDCGSYELHPGHILNIKGSSKPCAWTFTGPEGSKVEAACSDVSIPKTRRCNTAALMVSTPRSNTARMCGRRSFLKIKKNSASLTISSAPRRKSKNVFSCDVFLRMPKNARYDCQCGIEYPARIIGGTTSAVNQYPWMANLRYSNMKKVICGAVVVSDTHVLTAAHCMSGLIMKRVRVTVAEHNLQTSWETAETSRRIAKVTTHPRYNPSRVNVADLVVITLDHPLPLNHFPVQPVCIPSSNAPSFEGEVGTVVGWGTTNADRNNYEFPDALQAAKVPILSNAECQETGYGNIIRNNLLCAGNLTHGGRDACVGDSGGPLTVVQNGRHVLAGLVSFGHSCALPEWPGIYTRISEYSDWIVDQIVTGIQCEQ